MDCDKAKRKLSAYIDNELSVKEKAAVLEHLNSCKTCPAELALLTGIDVFAKKIKPIQVSSGFRDGLWERIRNEENAGESGSLWDKFFLRWIPVPVICSALIVIFAGFTALSPLVYAVQGGNASNKVIALVGKSISSGSILGPVNFSAFCDNCHEMLCEGCENCADGACSMESEVKK